jgi:hypothetical protein
MIRFKSTLQRFGSQGEKTGWTYILVTAAMAGKLIPGNKKGFRVKGKIDHCDYHMISLIPMGGGDFILTVNAALRKALKKQKGAPVEVVMEVDHDEISTPSDLLECMADEPEILARFNAMIKSHRNYYINWINSAKTDPTRAKRIAATIQAMENNWDFGQMLRSMKQNKIS